MQGRWHVKSGGIANRAGMERFRRDGKDGPGSAAPDTAGGDHPLLLRWERLDVVTGYWEVSLQVAKNVVVNDFICQT